MPIGVFTGSLHVATIDMTLVASKDLPYAITGCRVPLLSYTDVLEFCGLGLACNAG